LDCISLNSLAQLFTLFPFYHKMVGYFRWNLEFHW